VAAGYGLHLGPTSGSNVALAVQNLEDLAMTNSPQNNDRNKNQAGQQQGGQANKDQQHQGQKDTGQGSQHGSNNPGQNPTRQSGGADSDRMNRKDGSKDGNR
jgi:hypothetical protein